MERRCRCAGKHTMWLCRQRCGKGSGTCSHGGSTADAHPSPELRQAPANSSCIQACSAQTQVLSAPSTCTSNTLTVSIHRSSSQSEKVAKFRCAERSINQQYRRLPGEYRCGSKLHAVVWHWGHGGYRSGSSHLFRRFTFIPCSLAGKLLVGPSSAGGRSAGI